MRKKACLAVVPFLLLLAGCGTDPEAKMDKLEIKDAPVPSPFVAGDTSGLWTATKTVIDPKGRAQTSSYTTFSLISSDSAVVGVYSGRFLLALKAGTAEIRASDDKSDLVSESSVKVTVVAAP